MTVYIYIYVCICPLQERGRQAFPVGFADYSPPIIGTKEMETVSRFSYGHLFYSFDSGGVCSMDPIWYMLWTWYVLGSRLERFRANSLHSAVQEWPGQ